MNSYKIFSVWFCEYFVHSFIFLLLINFMTSWLFECVCLQEDDSPPNKLHSSSTSSSSTHLRNKNKIENSNHKKLNHKIDSIIIYTGAEGSRDFVDDGSYDDESFSETQSNYDSGISEIEGIYLLI